MPLYRYTCKSCEHPFEAFVQSSTVPSCPECGAEELEKRFTAFAVRGGVGAGGNKMEAPSCNTGSCATGSCPFV